MQTDNFSLNRTRTNDASATSGLLTADDLYLFNEGNHLRLYEKLGAHPLPSTAKPTTNFAVWAPNAVRVSLEVFGSEPASIPLRARGRSGIWEGIADRVGIGAIYKYRVTARSGQEFEKADPFGFQAELSPKTASVVATLNYDWTDRAWMADRYRRNSANSPISVYEMHLGSWRRGAGGRFLNYRELAPLLIEHLKTTGFTHVEFLPVMEHPFYGSWGYQTTGYFAPTSRYGSPQDLMYLIDSLHQNDLGVILDWVPSHFPGDGHGLVYFDGTHLFEHADPRQGFHPDWNSYIFNYGRNEVRSFLLSSALFWLDKYHIDGLRVDAVASMLYLDYSRKPGEWVPNRFGGRENLEAIDFLRQLNREIYKHYPDVQTIAEESTAWPMVSRPVHLGGLGFGMKWDMGWMHDTLHYFHQDPIHRKFQHDKLTFRQVYAFNENFMLPLSHDEVVYGKGSLWNQMPGDEWKKSANLRSLLGYMTAQPGKKLLFMGAEFGARQEWNHDRALDWGLLADERHRGNQRWLSDLNMLYRSEHALYELDFEEDGFRWINCCDSDQSVIAFQRIARSPDSSIVIVCNFTPVPRSNYRIGVPRSGHWRELLNSDATFYGGSGSGNAGGVGTENISSFGFEASLNLTLPPLGILFLKAVA